ncbi:eukaryotic initiation factor 4E [Trichuris suis]|nr:eukaryotic initiation factor 4E [Trichuris suis]
MEAKTEAVSALQPQQAMENGVAVTNYTESSENVNRPIHPLKYSWCLWFLDGESSLTSWVERLDRVAAVSTLEEFGALYQSMKEPSQLSPGTDLYFFKREIRPLWDHPANVKGGRWILSMGDNLGRMDAVWMHLLICIVGNWFRKLQTQICGVVANVRKRKSKICVWTKCASERTKTIKLGLAVKEFLKIQDMMVYEVHEGREKANHNGPKIIYRL